MRTLGRIQIIWKLYPGISTQKCDAQCFMNVLGTKGAQCLCIHYTMKMVHYIDEFGCKKVQNSDETIYSN